MQVRHLSQAEIEELSKVNNMEYMKGKVTMLRFTMYDDQQPQVTGFPWPIEHQNPQAVHLLNLLRRQVQGGEFTLLTRSVADSNL